jgi:hypothetical protein
LRLTQGRRATNLLGLEEVLGIRKQHLFDAGIKNDGRYGSLVAGISPAPTTMGICEIYLYPMNGLRLVLLLRLENKLFEDGVVACNDTEKEMKNSLSYL